MRLSRTGLWRQENYSSSLTYPRLEKLLVRVLQLDCEDGAGILLTL